MFNRERARTGAIVLARSFAERTFLSTSTNPAPYGLLELQRVACLYTGGRIGKCDPLLEVLTLTECGTAIGLSLLLSH